MPILTLEEVGKVGECDNDIMMEPLRGLRDVSCDIPIMMEPLRGSRYVSCEIPIMMEPLRGSRERG